MTVSIEIPVQPPPPPPPPPADELPPPPAELARACRDCHPATLAECQRRFGKFWHAKSSCGSGCNHPIDQT